LLLRTRFKEINDSTACARALVPLNVDLKNPGTRLGEAQLRLPELIASLQPGEELQIFVGDRTVCRQTNWRTPIREQASPAR
jgi:hypothetical protein